MSDAHQPTDRSGAVFQAALEYHARRWSVIPIRLMTKKPACRTWEPYQARPAAEQQLRRWFGNGRRHNVAVVLGPVSGGLVCRDFDTMDAYEKWAAAHPDLATTLPTVATARGRHVYFRASVDRIVKFDDGELRGNGYCLLPPSIHPSGAAYLWLVPLPLGELPVIDDVHVAGFCSDGARVTESTEKTDEDGEHPRPPKTTEAMVGGCVEQQIDPDTVNVIMQNLPTGVGRRNSQVFQFARVLKGMAQWADAPAEACKAVVRHWHLAGRERGLIGTEPFEETWIDFLKAWPKVKFPKGANPMCEVLASVLQQPLPACAARYEQAELQRLVGLCAELQRMWGAQPFFLGCRTAAEALGLLDANGQPHYVKTWRWLFLLVKEGILTEVEKGNNKCRRASRFRYLRD